MYYLMGNAYRENKESLQNFLLKNERTDTGLYSCREVLNRALQDRSRNILVADQNQLIPGKYFEPMEVLGNRENIQKLLQNIIRNNVDGSIEVVVGNRFFYWTPATRMRSPVGSLIAGILKIVVKFSCVSEDYEKFKKELMDTAISAGSYLSDYTTNASVAMAIKLFSEYKMPSDPNAGYSAMGTNQYLQNVKYYEPTNFESRRKELYEDFLTVIKESTVNHFFRDEV